MLQRQCSSAQASTSGRNQHCPGAAPAASRASCRTRRRHVCLAVSPNRAPTVLSAAVELRHSAPQARVATGVPVSTAFHNSGEAKYDVLGLAQAMVDFTAALPNEQMLAQAPFAPLPKGGRRVIGVDERHTIMDALEDEGCATEVSPGGSLANTLVAISRLAKAHGELARVGLAGMVSDDTLGSFFNHQLAEAGVQVQLDDDLKCHTGTVMVLCTPDAQRSFLSFFDSSAVRLTASMRRAISSARLVVIEGYMLELPGAEQWVREVAEVAQATGAQLVLTAGDPSVVRRHRAELRDLLARRLVSVMFCNKEEAAELLACCDGQQQGQGQGQQQECLLGEAASSNACCPAAMSADEAARALGALCPVAVVTDGARGSSIAALGAVHSIGAVEGAEVLDVCGAGDAFAGGVVYAMLQGHDMLTAGRFASQVAAAVIARHGAQLVEEDALQLVKALPSSVLLPQWWPASSKSGSVKSILA